MPGVGQTISKFGTFFEKYVPHSMPIFEKKSHPIRPVEGLKLCFDYIKNQCKVWDLSQDVSDKIFFFENWNRVRYIFFKKGPQLWNSLAHTCHAQSSDCQGCLSSKP